MRTGLLILLLLSWVASPAFAAYRVYKIKVEQYNAYGKLERTETVLTTLDPYQYEHYHSGYRWIRVILNDTWYCPGDTGNRRKYCDPPKVKPRGLANYDHEKRYPVPYTRQPVIP